MLHRLMNSAIVVILAATVIVGQASASPTAAILHTGLPGENGDFVSELTKSIANSGYSTAEIGFDIITEPNALDPRKYDLLVLSDSGALPALASKPIENYLRAGGDIIALNAPLWQQSLIKHNGNWISRETYIADTAALIDARTIIDYSSDSMSSWIVSNDHYVSGLVHEAVDSGPEQGQRALHVKVPRLYGWDAYCLPKIDRPFRDGAALTVFQAKGGADTTQMGVEWYERDASRWVAGVPITDQWTRYVLTPGDFHYAGNNPSRAKDRFRPENAIDFNVQVAIGTTDYRGDKSLEFWVGPISTAKLADHEKEITDCDIPRLDGLCPSYHLFDCSGNTSLFQQRGIVAATAESIAPAKTIRAAYARPTGTGFEKRRSSRFIPVVDAQGPSAEPRGVPVSLLIHTDGDYKKGMWASFGIGDMDWYRSPDALSIIGQLANDMRKGVFLAEGGANFYTYFEDQSVKLGARVANLGKNQCQAEVQIDVVSPTTGDVVFSRTWPIDLAPGGDQSVSTTWKPDSWPESGYLVQVVLKIDGRTADSLSHKIHTWRPKKNPEFVTVKNGQFMLNGKPWWPHGINYMPSYNQAQENLSLYNNWLGAEMYDPDLVQHDLNQLKSIGFNSVSIFHYDYAAKGQNLLDFLRRCDLLGLKVNLFLGPSYPRDYDFAPIKSMIEHYRLADNDVLFAYDVDWEPLWRGHDKRLAWDRDWENWVVERYGSIDNAEGDWQFAIPRDKDGKVTNPSSQQIDTDGDWRRMVAAYRRFLDTLLYKKYSAVTRCIKGIDPNHLVSFRMSDAGSPTFKTNGWMAYDFPYLAAAVDFLSPEGYGRVGAWERTKPGWFEREYARWAAPSVPMVWAEVGNSAWDMGTMSCSPKRLEYQAMVYRNYYELMKQAGADGIYWWFYAGGYRCDERCDYGIVNPDGSDRPVTRVIREYGRRPPAFHDSGANETQRQATAIDWITIDRDKHPDGVYGIYKEVQDQFWKSIDLGRSPRLRTEGTGTTSANCPLLAVGNTPCNGSNPPKYLDGVFDSVEVLNAKGDWVRVENSATVKINDAKPVVARVTIRNLGEAEWITLGTGAVCVIAQSAETIKTPLLSAVPHAALATLTNLTIAPAGLTKPLEVSISLNAEGRTGFGEKFRFTLHP